MFVTSHLMGLFSVFPAEMVNEANFVTGGLSAVKGNLSSSLLDVSVKRQYGARFNGKMTLSPYMTGLYTSIPLLKDKASIQLSARSSFLPYLVKLMNNDSRNMTIHMYDVSSIIDYRISDKNYLDAMFYATNDKFAYRYNDNSSNMQNWRAIIGKIGWRSVLSERFNIYLWAYYNTTHSAQKEVRYDGDESTLVSMLGMSSGLKEFAVTTKFNYSISDNFSCNAGIAMQKQTFLPVNEKFVASKSENNNYEEIVRNKMWSFFGELSYNVDRLIDVKLGYRHTLQKTDSISRPGFDLHILSHLYINENLGLEVTFDRLTQYYHVLEGLPTGWSLNMMTPNSRRFPAELTHQYYTGAFFKKRSGKVLLNFSLGGYYRNMKNLVTYTNGVNAFGFNSSSWGEEVDLGVGKSYGLELSGSVQLDRLGSTLAYTLSKSDRQFPRINNGDAFPFKFDRRHILNLQTKFTLSKYTTSKGTAIEHILNAVVAYSTGNRATIPIGSYQGEMPPYWDKYPPGHLYPDEFYDNIYDRKLMSSRNGFVMKDYFRIDAAYTLICKGKRMTNEFSLSIFNILNRRNPYTYFYEKGEWKQLSIMPIMPTIRWSLSW